MEHGDAFEMCRGFSNKDWKQLSTDLAAPEKAAELDINFKLAVDVFKQRMYERFISCIDVLELADSRSAVAYTKPGCNEMPELPGTNEVAIVPGFCIVGLCCMVIETLQSFRGGRGKTSRLLKAFLRRQSFGGEFDDEEVADAFVRGIRHGIAHDAETRGWIIWRDEPHGRIVMRRSESPRVYALNRTLFYLAVKAELEQYILELRVSRNVSLRSSFIQKMDQIAAR